MAGRPKKIKIVRKNPTIKYFSPRGRIGRPGTMELRIEEFEAIRLADHLGLGQREAAGFMGISQQTFSRVLKNGRKCLAGALIKGLIIHIKGGDFRLEK